MHSISEPSMLLYYCAFPNKDKFRFCILTNTSFSYNVRIYLDIRPNVVFNIATFLKFNCFIYIPYELCKYTRFVQVAKL